MEPAQRLTAYLLDDPARLRPGMLFSVRGRPFRLGDSSKWTTRDTSTVDPATVNMLLAKRDRAVVELCDPGTVGGLQDLLEPEEVRGVCIVVAESMRLADEGESGVVTLEAAVVAALLRR